MTSGISEDNIEPYRFKYPGTSMPTLSDKYSISSVPQLFMNCLESSPLLRICQRLEKQSSYQCFPYYPIFSQLLLTSFKRVQSYLQKIFVNIFIEYYNHLNNFPHCRSKLQNCSMSINTHFQYILSTWVMTNCLKTSMKHKI